MLAMKLHNKKNWRVTQNKMRRRLVTSQSKIGKARIDAIRIAESNGKKDLISKIQNCATESAINNLVKDLK